MKRCRTCKRDYPLDSFQPDPRYVGGRKHHCRWCESKKQTERNQAYRLAALVVLGDDCVRCGIDDMRVLVIDHVEGGGKQDRARFKGPNAFYRHVMEHPAAYQLLCHNCNHLKRIERAEHAPYNRHVVG